MTKPSPRRSLSFAVLACALVVALIGCSDSPREVETIGRRDDALFANDKAMYDYFVGKGLTSFQSAGIVGNLDQESGGDPRAVQPGGPGRGIAQWSVGGRWDTGSSNVTSFASSKGKSVWALDLQLDFIWHELTTFPGYGLAALKASTNVADAVRVFQNKYEVCGTCAETQRIKYANDVLAAFGKAPDYAAQFVSQSFPLASTTLTMSGGDVLPSFIELKNVGSKAWDSSTKLATTQARDRASVFAHASWPANNRPAAVVGTVPPGGTYKFAFSLEAPTTPGTHDEFFGVVQEGVAWFSDPGQGGPRDDQLEVKIVVTKGAVVDSGVPAVDSGAPVDATPPADAGPSVDGALASDAATDADAAALPDDGDTVGSISCDVGASRRKPPPGASIAAVTGLLAFAGLLRRPRGARR